MIDRHFMWADGPPELESHSRAKLAALRRYLRDYLSCVLGFRRDRFRLGLVDGFCGGGEFLYNGGTVSGTPLIMLEEGKAAEQQLRSRQEKPIDFQMRYYFNDTERSHIDYLKRRLQEHAANPDTHRIRFENDRFEDVVDKIIADIKTWQPLSGRSIWLLDQCGYSQVPFAYIRQIFSELPNAEVILTFATDALLAHLHLVKRQAKANNRIELSDERIDELLAMENGAGGRALIQRALRDHLREAVGIGYDTPFFIRPSVSHRGLWFIHLSRHPKARDVMLRTHWEEKNAFIHDGTGDLQMLGWDALNALKESDQLPLFGFTSDDRETMMDSLCGQLPARIESLSGGDAITVDGLRRETANDHAATIADQDEALVRLATNREIEILNKDRVPRSKRTQHLNPDDMIRIPRQRYLIL